MDQILPFFIAEVGASFPGIAGIFVAGIFSAALRFVITAIAYTILTTAPYCSCSTLSTVLNSVSCVFLNDIVNPLLKEPLGEKQASWVLKGTVLVAGLLSMGLVFVLSHLGTIFQVKSFVISSKFMFNFLHTS
jgi:solute carrier family 5 (sodium-coupled monocarboxylate transporter), member 8/12